MARSILSAGVTVATTLCVGTGASADVADGLDLGALLDVRSRRQKTGRCAADLNDDGVVNGLDIGVMLGHLG